MLKGLELIASSVEDKTERAMLALSFLEESAKQPCPGIERLPTHFYEDGIEGVETSLRFRRAIAYKRWIGNTDYTYYDLIQESLFGPKGDS